MDNCSIMEFVIRTYTKKELALLYFPKSLPRTAVAHLMDWIRRCKPLPTLLAEAGYTPSTKVFTPRQLRIIVEHLGEPAS